MEALKILVVDDDRGIHRDFERILGTVAQPTSELDELEADLFGGSPSPAPRSGLSFALDHAHQGQEGVDAVSRARAADAAYAVAFVDVRMPPGIDGVETVGRMWAVDPDLQIVLCTAFSDHSWEEIHARYGERDNLLIIKKPFDRMEIVQAAHTLTKKWKAHQDVARRLTDLDRLVAARTAELEATNARLSDEIDQRTRAQQDMEHLATHDPLTGLPNRILIRRSIEGALAQAGLDSTVVMLLDLDRFKAINDTLGHDAGDALLVEVSRRLSRVVRQHDVVGRLGGDEFVVVLPRVASREVAEAVATRVVEAFAAPVALAGQAHRISPSVGVAIHPQDGSTVDQLLKAADTAMYEVKANGRGAFRFCTTACLSQQSERSRMRSELDEAIDAGELELHYQPIVGLDSEVIVGFEALVRWRHPEQGLVPPMRFLPLAEATDLMGKLGDWVFEEACRQLGTWALPAEFTLAVNLSPSQLRDPMLVPRLHRCVARHGVEPSTLEMEVSEATILDDFDRVMPVLTALAELGVRIAVDDFGAGLASLRRLRELPIHTVKLDGAFVRNVTNTPRDAAIVAGVVAMARSLGVRVVAEGVESAAQLDTLRQLTHAAERVLREQRVQGYLVGRPLPSGEATELLSRSTVTWDRAG